MDLDGLAKKRAPGKRVRGVCGQNRVLFAGVAGKQPAAELNDEHG